ncbi:MAG: hypothetical protein DRN06_07235 [Thermoprotei archaeon]|nr:MAG: hypothetical protein DRN06_07235 [Thermoprotei archaeon]
MIKQVEKKLMELIELEESLEQEGVLIGREDVLKKILESSEVILITGKRGAGKTALGYYILEQSPNPYVFGLPEEAWRYLPKFITPLKSLEKLPEKATIFIDEAALWFYSRSSSQKMNKYISQLVTEARHQEQLLIFATHTLRKLDIGVVMDADAILFKEPSFLHSKFERSEIREITREVKEQFSKLRGDRRKYTYVLSHDYEGFLKTPLPSFWCEELSKAQISLERVFEGEGDRRAGVGSKIESGNIESVLKERPEYIEYFERMLEWHDKNKDSKFYHLGFEWSDVRVPPQILNKLFLQGVLDLVYNTRKHKGYLLRNPEEVREVVEKKKR